LTGATDIVCPREFLMWGGRIQGVAVGGNIAIIPLFAGR